MSSVKGNKEEFQNLQRVSNGKNLFGNSENGRNLIAQSYADSLDSLVVDENILGKFGSKNHSQTEKFDRYEENESLVINNNTNALVNINMLEHPTRFRSDFNDYENEL